MTTKNYTLFLSSADKISGNNNNATFNVNFDAFIPRNYDTYQLSFSFNATAGYYKDTANTTVYSHAKIILDTIGRSFTYDTSRNGPSITLGYANREPSTATSNTNGFNCFYNYNPPITINRPNQNQITVKIYNVQTNTLLVDTTNAGVAQADMTPWILSISLTPILDSKQLKSITDE